MGASGRREYGAAVLWTSLLCAWAAVAPRGVPSDARGAVLVGCVHFRNGMGVARPAGSHLACWHLVPWLFLGIYYLGFVRRIEIGGGPKLALGDVLGTLAAFCLGLPSGWGVIVALPILLGVTFFGLVLLWRRWNGQLRGTLCDGEFCLGPAIRALFQPVRPAVSALFHRECGAGPSGRGLCAGVAVECRAGCARHGHGVARRISCGQRGPATRAGCSATGAASIRRRCSILRRTRQRVRSWCR